MDIIGLKSVKLSELPEDVIVMILSQCLSPWDLVAVSHTCRSLRTCSNVRAVWARVWARSRGDNNLRWIPPANLNLPRQLSGHESELDGVDDLDSPLSQTSLAPSSLPDPHNEASETSTSSQPRTSAGSSDYAAHFWKTLRIRHGMRQLKAIIRPVLQSMVIEDEGKSKSWKLLPDGNFLLSWALDARTLVLYDLRYQSKHDIALPIPATIGAIDGDTIRYKDRDGIFLIVSARRTGDDSSRIDLLFQPISLGPNAHRLPAVERLAVINPTVADEYIHFKFSTRRFLIVHGLKGGDEAKSSIRVYDIVGGEFYSLVVPDVAITGLRVCQDNVLFWTRYMYSGDGVGWRHRAVRLTDLNEDPNLSKPAQIVKTDDSPPSSRPDSSVLSYIWEKHSQVTLTAQLSYQSGPPRHEDTEGPQPPPHQPESLPRDQGDRYWLGSPITRLLPLNTIGQFLNEYDERPSIKQVHLSILASSIRQDEVLGGMSTIATQSQMLVYSRLSRSPHDSNLHIMYHPLYVQRDAARPPTPFIIGTNSSFPPLLAWDEFSGRIIVRAYDDTKRTIAIYEFVPSS